MLVDYILLYVKKKRSVGCGKTKLRRPWSLREDERIELEVDRVGRSFLRGKKRSGKTKSMGKFGHTSKPRSQVMMENFFGFISQNVQQNKETLVNSDQ